MTAARQPAAKSPRRAVAAADRTRQPTEVRRRLIVEAAVPLIAERGYASVGVRDVAAAAGVSVGTVTYHFGSVQEILFEAMVLHIERYYAELNEAAEQATSGAEALRLLVDALFTEDTDRHWRMWFDYWNAGEQAPTRPSVAARPIATRPGTSRSALWPNGASPTASSPPTTSTASPSALPPSPTASPSNGCARHRR